MKNLKKISAILALLMGVTACTACGGGGKPGAGAGGQNIADDKQTVEIYYTETGYGIDWLNESIKDFEAKNPDINIEMWSERGETGRAMLLAEGGPERTKVDLIITSEKLNFLVRKGDKGIKGYDNIFEDLTDMYKEKVPGEDITFEDKMKEDIKIGLRYEQEDADGTYSDHYYLTSHASGLSGIIYNKNVFNDCGVEDIPLTTDEFFEVCDTIKSKNIYPYICSIPIGYYYDLAIGWWAQYSGEAYTKCVDGRNVNGELDHTIFDDKGRLYNLQALEKLLDQETTKYTNPNSKGYDFIEAQARMIKGEGAMISCGDYFENEMKNILDQSGKKGQFYFLKLPLISAFSDKLSYWDKNLGDYDSASADPANRAKLDEYDAKLRAIVAYTEGKGEKPAGVTDEDISKVKMAYNTVPSVGGQTSVCGILSYSNAKEAAKEFLKYLATDDAIEIWTKYTSNCLSPYNYDYENSALWNTFSPSRKEIVKIRDDIQHGSKTWVVGNAQNDLGLFFYKDSLNFTKEGKDHVSARTVYENSRLSKKEYDELLKNAGLM